MALTTLGCKTNRADGEELWRRMEGWAVAVPFSAEADLYIINSCTGTEAAERQTRQLIYRARRLAPAAKVILTGCLVRMLAQTPARQIAGLDRSFSLGEHELLVTYAQQLWRDLNPSTNWPAMREQPISTLSRRARAVLKIQDGCDCACSYCIVPHVRGPSRSKGLELVEREARDLVEGQGFQELVLTGIHLGLYGRDLDPPSSLPEALGRLLLFVPRIRLSSLEPLEVDEPLLAHFAADGQGATGKLCPYLHVPVQHIDDAMLELMNRPYRLAQISALLQGLRRRFPEMALGTDLLTGFPGESEAQFQRLLDYVQASPLTHLHVFSFSPRPETVAANLPGRISSSIGKRRVALLREAGALKLAAFAAAQIGKTRAVLVEHPRSGSAGKLNGLTDNYLRVEFSGPPSLISAIAPVLITEARGGDLAGELATATARERTESAAR